MPAYENLDTMRAELTKLLAEKALRERADGERKAKSQARQLQALRDRPVKWQVSSAGDRIGAYGIPYLTDAQWVAVLRAENTESLLVMLDERGGGSDTE